MDYAKTDMYIRSVFSITMYGLEILFAKALEDYSKICSVLDIEDRGCMQRSQKLQAAIFDKFFDTEKQVFIDSYESGKRNVTRHSNLLAYLFLPCSKEQKTSF